MSIDEEISEYRKVLEEDPDNIIVRCELAAAYVM